AARLEPIPRPIRAGIAAAARFLPEPMAVPQLRRLRRFAMTLGMSRASRYARWTGFFANEPRIFGARLRELPLTDPYSAAVAEAMPTDALEGMLAIDM